MADNINVTAGAGKTIAADEVGGALYQRIKLCLGADNTAVDTPAGQQLMAASLPVVIASNQASIPVASTLTAETTKVIGVVRGTPFDVTATLTVTNGAYAVADVVGGLITWASVAGQNGGSVLINTIVLNGVVAIPYELWFFSADIATPRLDNAVFGMAAADGLIHLGTVPIAAADYFAAQTAFNAATIRGVGLQVSLGAATTSLYGYLKATAVTSPGTATLYLRIIGERIN